MRVFFRQASRPCVRLQRRAWAFFDVTALGGILPSIKASFSGIDSVAKIFLLRIAHSCPYALVSNTCQFRGVCGQVRVRHARAILAAALLFILPLLAFRTGARLVLRGLFDLTPASLFAVAFGLKWPLL